MRETSFIKQNKEKWKEFESILEKKDKDPDKLNDLFIQITDDLSYSRTFYPNRSVRVYLNNLAQQVFHSIYKNKKSRFSRLLFFWTDELPQLVYESRRAFRLSFFAPSYRRVMTPSRKSKTACWPQRSLGVTSLFPHRPVQARPLRLV